MFLKKGKEKREKDCVSKLYLCFKIKLFTSVLSLVTPQNTAVATDKIRVAFHTLGCKLNFSETAEIAKDFSSLHYDRVSFDEAADVYVINTCSVTENADKRFKALVAKVLRQNDEAVVAAIGCYA